MNVRELKECLDEFDPEMEVAITGTSNGQGQPRAINFFPQINDPADWAMSEEEQAATKAQGDNNDYSDVLSPMYVENDYSDLETEQGGLIVVMGYGCY